MHPSLRLLITLGTAALLAGLTTPATAAVWRVKAGESIQVAIDRAEPGDTIEIERARYFGHLLVDKPLTLRGINRPTIDGELKENTISVKAENVTVEGLIVAN